MKGDSICAFCSRMKRGVLYSCCRKEGYNKLVLGQHLDDLAESFFMSVFRNGKVCAPACDLMRFRVLAASTDACSGPFCCRSSDQLINLWELSDPPRPKRVRPSAVETRFLRQSDVQAIFLSVCVAYVALWLIGARVP